MSAVFAQQKKRLLCAVMREIKAFKSVGFSAVGTVSQLKEYSIKTKRSWTIGLRLRPALK
ncbi:hypothetical protein [Marinicella gelatinilytica]|uniref:hypothetical protein n=1 Tax=Marinicella gelatinilytica TaxID=2996017 RepID=UPI002260D19B|nr:hypothetical protein [Marinicella gelatinilytica]MCX7544496.1 hypothetical protein [Marinicella gelatinilytica]